MNKYVAEFLGTFILVLCGCGSAVLSATFPEVGIGLLGVALAFGLAVMGVAYSLGHISGAHLNPAVTLGLWAGGRADGRLIVPYIIAQTAGAIAGAGVLYVIATGNGSDIGGFACNGYEEHSPGKYSMMAVILTEFIMTFIFLIIILGATDPKSPDGFAGIAIGLGLTFLHLASIPVSNTSLNPARSLATAIFVGDWAIAQVWVFLLIPILGGLAAGAVYKMIRE